MEGEEVAFIPNYDLVLVLLDKNIEKTSGGIFIPDAYQVKTHKGNIAVTGPGTKENTIRVKKGDRVSYPDFAGTEITIDGKEYLMIRQSDIIVIN